MRPKDIPRMVFRRLEKFTGMQPYYLDLGPYAKYSTLFLNSSDTVAGYCLDGRGPTFAYLKVWPFHYRQQDDVRKTMQTEEPWMQIIGGPFSTGDRDEELGNFLTEEVRIAYGSQLLSGVAADDPCICAMQALGYWTCTMVRRAALYNPSYWEAAFKKDKTDYRQPP